MVERAEENTNEVDRKRGDVDELHRKIEEAAGSGRSVAEVVNDLADDLADEQVVEALREASWRLVEREDYAAAVRVLGQMAELQPLNIDVRIELGKTHLRRGDLAKAYGAIERAFDVALKMSAQDRCEEILELMERVDVPRSRRLVKRGELLLAWEEKDRALACFEEAAKLFEDEGLRQDFLAVGRRILELAPGDDSMRYKVAETLIAEGRAFRDLGLFDKAIRKLFKALKYTPEQVETYEMLARVLVDAGRVQGAVDILVSAARRFDDASRPRRLLKLARELGAPAEQIEVIAEELEVDLFEEGLEETTDVFEEELSGGLGDKETSVKYASAKDEPESGSPTPEVVAPARVGAIDAILELLEVIDECVEPIRLIAFSEEPSDGVEMLVSRGRLFPGFRVDGAYPKLDELVGEDTPEYREKERAALDQLWKRVCHGGDEEPKIEVDDDRRRVLRRRVAAGLELVRRRVEGDSLQILMFEAEAPPRFPVSFSTSSVLLELGRLVAPAHPEKIDAFEALRELNGDQIWCFRRAADGERFIPVRYEGRGNRPPLTRMRTAMQLADVLGASMQKFGSDDAAGRPKTWSLVFEDVAWGAVWSDDTLWLTSIRTNQLGRMMRQLKALTERGER
ncbi:MAG: tetratricopeptide repeat protein [Persicimonas sp.]